MTPFEYVVACGIVFAMLTKGTMALTNLYRAMRPAEAAPPASGPAAKTKRVMQGFSEAHVNGSKARQEVTARVDKELEEILK